MIFGFPDDISEPYNTTTYYLSNFKLVFFEMAFSISPEKYILLVPTTFNYWKYVNLRGDIPQ